MSRPLVETAKAGTWPAFVKEGEAPEGYFVIVVGIMQHIIVMPPQLIIIGMPAAIMFIIPWSTLR